MKNLRHPILLIALANTGLWSLPWALDLSESILARWRQLPQFVGGTSEQNDAMGLLQVGVLPHSSINQGSDTLSVQAHSPSLVADPTVRVAATTPAASLGLETIHNASHSQASHRAPEPQRSIPLDLASTAAMQPSSLMRRLRQADGLGGEITLASLQEPAMPSAARAERLQQQRSGDPLAALPLHWRSALRDQLNSAQPVSRVAMVRVPAPGLGERQEIPIVVDDKGEGEAFVSPRNASIQKVVEQWAAKQSPAEPGTVHILVVAVEPLASAGK